MFRNPLRRIRSILPVNYEKIVADNLAKNTFEITNRTPTLSSTPILFQMDLIGVCNMHPPCPMCQFNWDGLYGKHYHTGLTLKDIHSFGAFFYNAHSVSTCCLGEPLLHPQLVDIFKLAKKTKKYVGITSNGLALTKEFADKILPYSEHVAIMFSLDAANQDTYSKVRGANFSELVSNITYYCQKRKKYPPSPHTYTALVFMPMRLNQNEIVDFVNLAAKTGVDRVILRLLSKIDSEKVINRKGYVFDYNNEQLSNEKLDEIRISAQKECDRLGLLLDCHYTFDEDYTFHEFVPPEFANLNIPCIMPWRFLFAFQNGDTYGCAYMKKSLGNWRKKGLKSFWNGAEMVAMREGLAKGILPPECLKNDSCPLVRKQTNRQKAKLETVAP